MDITIGEALMNSAIGFLIVFAVLALLIGFIKILSAAVNKLEEGTNAKKDVKTKTPSEAPLAEGSCGEVKLFDVPDRTAAMLMAIVADKLQTPLNELRFISIREVKDEEQTK